MLEDTGWLKLANSWTKDNDEAYDDIKKNMKISCCVSAGLRAFSL